LAQKSGGKKNVIIPYRESKLTRLLQNALGGSSKTIMICALSPASSNYEETLSTLRYADRAKKIKNNAVVNENPQERLMRELREENQKLKDFMESVKDTLGEQDAAVLNERVKEIKAAEEVLKEQQKSWAERLDESKEVEKERSCRRSITRINVGMHVDVPHIVNLNEDMLLTGRIKHRFPEGTVMRIGQVGVDREDADSVVNSDDEASPMAEPEEDADAEAEPDIHIAGEGVLASHATIENKGGRCILRSKGKAADATHVNGVSVAVLIKQLEVEEKGKRNSLLAGEAPAEEEDGIVLNHGDRVAFSQCLFVFVDPALGVSEMLIMSGQVSYFAARKELAKNQWKSAGLKFMKGMKLQHAFGGQDLQNKMLKRMSSAPIGGLDLSKLQGLAANKPGKGGREGSSDDDSDSDDDLEDSIEQLLKSGNFNADSAVEVIRAKDQQLADLKKQLAEKDRVIAELRAAAAAGPPPDQQAPRSSRSERHSGTSAPRMEASTKELPNLAGLVPRKPCDVRAEIAATFESAISAIQQVEALFATQQANRKQVAA